MYSTGNLEGLLLMQGETKAETAVSFFSQNVWIFFKRIKELDGPPASSQMMHLYEVFHLLPLFKPVNGTR